MVVPPAALLGEAAGELVAAGLAVAEGEATGLAVADAEGLTTGDTAGEIVADGEGVAAGDAVADGEAVRPDGSTVINDVHTTGGFIGVPSVFTNWTDRICTPGMTPGQVKEVAELLLKVPARVFAERLGNVGGVASR